MNGFIIGTGRCGTTMLASLLDTHSQICVPPETQLLFQYRGNGVGLHEIFATGAQWNANADDFIEFVEARCPHDFGRYFDYVGYFSARQYPVATLDALMASFYSEIATAKGKRVCIEQTPWYGLGIDILDQLYPDARYIHMVHDGRDVAISYARTPWWTKDIGANLARWAVESDLIRTSCSVLLPPERVLVVRYEDFVQEPERGLRTVCDFLQVPYESRMLEPGAATDYGMFDKRTNSGMLSAAQKKWSQSKSHAVFKESAGAWKSYGDYDFSSLPQDVRRCLDSFGYA